MDQPLVRVLPTSLNNPISDPFWNINHPILFGTSTSPHRSAPVSPTLAH